MRKKRSRKEIAHLGAKKVKNHKTLQINNLVLNSCALFAHFCTPLRIAPKKLPASELGKYRFW
jgi:hypothetical protein